MINHTEIYSSNKCDNDSEVIFAIFLYDLNREERWQ